MTEADVDNNPTCQEEERDRFILDTLTDLLVDFEPALLLCGLTVDEVEQWLQKRDISHRAIALLTRP